MAERIEPMKIEITFELAALIENVRHHKSMIVYYGGELSRLSKYEQYDGRSRNGKLFRKIKTAYENQSAHWQKALTDLGTMISDCTLSDEELHEFMENIVLNQE